MGVDIHPMAVVEEGAQFGVGVSVEAFCHIGKLAKIGDNSIIRHHASVEGDVIMGTDNEIFPYAYVGGLTHDLKFGGTPKLRIGSIIIQRVRYRTCCNRIMNLPQLGPIMYFLQCIYLGAWLVMRSS